MGSEMCIRDSYHGVKGPRSGNFWRVRRLFVSHSANKHRTTLAKASSESPSFGLHFISFHRRRPMSSTWCKRRLKVKNHGYSRKIDIDCIDRGAGISSRAYMLNLAGWFLPDRQKSLRKRQFPSLANLLNRRRYGWLARLAIICVLHPISGVLSLFFCVP